MDLVAPPTVPSSGRYSRAGACSLWPPAGSSATTRPPGTGSGGVNPDPAFGTTYGSVALAGGLVIIGEQSCDSVSDPNGFVQAFHADTGAPAWLKPTTPAGGPLSDVVVAEGDVVAVGNSEGGGTPVAVRRVADCSLVWSHTPDICNPSATVLVVHRTVIYGGCGKNDSPALVADHLTTGRRAWARAGSWKPERGDRSTAAGRNLFAVNPAGQVADLRPQSRRTRYILTGATGVLAVDSSRVYAQCGSTHICAYRTSTGAPLWTVADSSSAAAEAGGVLYLSDGRALKASSGAGLRRIFRRGRQASALVVGDGWIAAANGARTLDFCGLPGS
jgi:outer membrane protein assembly factor BamB